MRVLGQSAQAALESGYKCWNLHLALTNGTQLGYTSAAESFDIDGITYQPQNGIIPAQYRGDLRPEPSSSEFQGFFSDDQLTELEIVAGAIDDAIATLFICSYKQPPLAIESNRALILSVGRLGKARNTDQAFTIEFLTAEQALQQSLRKRTQPSCRNTLGDSRCGVNVQGYRFLAEVTAVSENRIITFQVINQNALAQPTLDTLYRNGRIDWSTGNNAGARGKIRRHTGNQIQLLSRPFSAIAVGDRFNAYPGCDKSITECNERYNNTDEFRGEPYVSGPASLIRSPDQ